MEMAELAVLDMGGLPLPPRWKGKSVFESQRCTDPCLMLVSFGCDDGASY